METMNPKGFEKGPNESAPAYLARLKAKAEQLSGDLSTSKQETQKGKKATASASIAAVALFLLCAILLWTNLGDRQEVRAAHKVELKKIQDENQQLKLAAQKPAKVEVVGVSAEDVEKIVGKKCDGKTVYLPAKPVAKQQRVAYKPAQRPMETAVHTSPPPAGGTFWGWVHPEATAANKRGCYADRLISGMPTQCSAVQVEPRVGVESEKQWNARIAAKNGIAVGVKDGKGTISSTTFSHVQVK